MSIKALMVRLFQTMKSSLLKQFQHHARYARSESLDEYSPGTRSEVRQIYRLFIQEFTGDREGVMEFLLANHRSLLGLPYL